MARYNNLPEFDNPSEHGSPIRWIKWLYLAVGLFVVCLLVWIFMALSKDNVNYQDIPPEAVTEQTTQTPGSSI